MPTKLAYWAYGRAELFESVKWSPFKIADKREYPFFLPHLLLPPQIPNQKLHSHQSSFQKPLLILHGVF
ncbi:hypothetical protein ACLB2K_014736 [Fragaria x ananassa]